MKHSREIVVVALVCAASMCVWRGAALVSLRASSARLLTDLQAAEQIVLEIDRLAKLPATALAPGTSDASLLRDIQEAFAAAGVPSASIRELAIDPRTDDRSGPVGMGLSRRSGRANCVGLTLPQLGRVLNTLRVSLPPVRIEQIALNKETNVTDPPQFRVSLTFAAYAPLPQTSTPVPAPGTR